MKKLFILLLAAGFAFSASAQYRSDNRIGQPKNDHSRYDHKKNAELERRLAIINRNYNTQIDYVKHNPHLRAKQKNKKIRELEKERTSAIAKCKVDFARGYREGYAKGMKKKNGW